MLYENLDEQSCVQGTSGATRDEEKGRTCMWDETGIIKRFIRLLSRSYSALFIHPGAFLLPFYKTLLLAMAHRKTGERKRMETGVLLIKIYERDSQISYAVVSAWDIRGI